MFILRLLQGQSSILFPFMGQKKQYLLRKSIAPLTTLLTFPRRLGFEDSNKEKATLAATPHPGAF